jgi:pyrroline-5-carboxylate reductase
MASSASLRIAILGTGNIGGSIARGLAAAGTVSPRDIVLTRRSVEHLEQFRAAGFRVQTDNAGAVSSSEVIILAVTPRQLNALLEEIKDTLVPGKHILVSVVSGASIAQMRDRIGSAVPIVRAMPNTAIAIRESMTCLAGGDASPEVMRTVIRLFETVGKTVEISEELMIPATALCACGIAFFLRAIRAASQGGIEIGFHAEDALLMAAQTAKGAAALLVEAGNHPESEVDKVTTPQGCTIAGLNQMEHNGFSSALIKGIVTSASKAAVLYSPKTG